jgi:DNA polymerase (family 10)
MIAPIRTNGSSPPGNEEVARRLAEVADRLEVEQDNPFRIQAYRNAVATLRGLDRPVSEILAEEGTAGLRRLPGIGQGLARTIEQLVNSGELSLLDELRGRDSPEGLLATVPGVGQKLAERIHRELGVNSLEDLEAAAEDGRLATIPGMGPRRLRGILDALAGRFFRRRPVAGKPADKSVPVAELLEVDAIYRRRAEEGSLPRIAPKRFNPTGEAWLPVLRLKRGGRRYRALFSNTSMAHRLGRTRDWVVIYVEENGRRQQWTVLTASAGKLKGKRIVRGRETESARFYEPREKKTNRRKEG